MFQPIDSILAKEISICPQFSLRFASFMLGLHVGALLILIVISYFYTDWPILTMSSILGFSVMFSAWRTYRHDLCFIQHPLYNSRLVILQEIETGDPPTEYLLLQNGQRAIVLSHYSYAHPLIVIINAKILDTNKSASLILWNDMLDKDIFRRLRVRIKHPFS
ncbi:protein YgfX [Candidatus Albibeggiatoa sp. nov. BB20]|uniref:protein YgfX n=1 Tax=Candidatus Albibeggiatoa sp. nov. BB20 TaxID=3162723 RepID=UPI0033658441